MKAKFNIEYDDWKAIENSSTGLPNMNNELLEAISKIASNDTIIIILTINKNAEFILRYDTVKQSFTENKIDS